jgi:YHS domain-containing protein
LLLAALLLAPLPAAAQAPAAAPIEVLEELDPVLLVRGREELGKSELTIDRGPFRYMFVSEETRAEFERHPERYEVQLGGLCARMGGASAGDPDLFAVHQGKIYLFGSEECRDKFVASPASFLPPEPAAPPAADAGSLRRGGELIERAVAAAGGAAAVDGLSAIRREATLRTWWTDEPEPIGEIEVEVYPDRLRRERKYPGGTFVQVVAADDAFSVGGETVQPLIPGASAALRHEAARTPLGILRARHDAGFSAAHTGSGEVGGRPAELVAVTAGGQATEVAVDRETGRIVALRWTDRGPGGTWGEVEQRFSDFRRTAGLELPYRVEATWNGEPDLRLSYEVAAIAVDPEIGPELFARPGNG